MHCRKWCSALVVMAGAVYGWDASCKHCEGYCSTFCRTVPVQNTICGSAHYCSPDDGHDDARNMLR